MKASWWDELRAAWWAADRDGSTPYALPPSAEVERYLAAKRAVAADLQPRTIGEFGVRTGYSAWALLSGCDAAYTGYDTGNPAEPGSVEHGERMLAARWPGRVSFVRADTHTLPCVPPFDLLHVDGDHTFAGCLADLRMAASSGVRHLLVDDYDYMPEVRRAVHAFALEMAIGLTHIDDGFRGCALLQVGA